jgi:hypothetical protein
MADHSEERAAKIEDRISKLENRPKLSIEDVDLRITAL